MERGVAAKVRRRPHARAGGHERRHELPVALPRGPMERRHTVALRRVDVAALLDHREHVRALAAHGRVGD